MAARLIIAVALVGALAACGGNDSSTPDTQPPSTGAPDASGSGDGGQTGDNGNAGGGSGDPSLELGSLGAPPDAAPQTAVAVVDGETYTFDAADLGSQRCEVSSDAIAINIGQSEDWFTFVAAPAGNSWAAGPNMGLEDGLQLEGLPTDAEIVVSGETVTFQGEVVVKPNPSDFDSWERTIGSVTVNCGPG